jgi:hypothetical protein
VNKNLENPLFLGTLAPATGCRNPHPLSWIEFLGGIASLLVVSLSLGEAAQGVTLAWDANSEPDMVGYVLRYGTTRGKPSQSINVDKTTTATVSNLASGKTYFFTVTERNRLGLESQPSNEVSYTTPTPSMVGSSNIAIGERKKAETEQITPTGGWNKANVLYEPQVSANTWLIMLGVAVFPWLGDSITAIGNIVRGRKHESDNSICKNRS